jgi:hypothetical protein
MWRRALATLHPDGGGSHDLFIWAGAVRDVVCDLGSLRAGANPEPADHPSRQREASGSEEPARVPYPAWADFEECTRTALRVGAGEAAGEAGMLYGPVLSLLADCYPTEGKAHEGQRGASYKRLAAIAHLWGMTKAERIGWYRVAEGIPLSDRHAGHILSRTNRRAA